MDDPVAVEAEPLEAGSVRRVIILRSSALGDVIHVLPSLEALRRTFPEAEITWLVEPLGAKLLEGHPDIEDLCVIPRQEWKRRLRNPLWWPAVLGEMLGFAWRLRRKRFDLVVDFQGNLRSAVTILLVGGRHRVGFHRSDVREFAGWWFTNRRIRPLPARMNKVAKNLELIRAVGYEGDCPRGTVAVRDEVRAWARSYLSSLSGRGPAVVLHPAVSRFGRFKQWPAENFRALVDLLREHLDARVAITWGPGEREIADAIERPNVLDEVIDLKHMAALLEAADLLVVADTGAGPLAVTMGTPAVSLYGPKDAVVYQPYPLLGEAIASSAPCSPCSLRWCEHRICMSLITPQAVFAAALRSLNCQVPDEGDPLARDDSSVRCAR